MSAAREARLYDRRWRDRVRQGAIDSASVIVPMLAERYLPQHVIDVGCGEGHFRDAFRELGIEAIGVDGDWVEGPDAHVDLERDLPRLAATDKWQFDMAVCLEVAEHLPATSAVDLVAMLVGLAPVVAFSAAIPGQGGVGHVNEQWPHYWSALFRALGYGWDDDLRLRLWENELVEPWYAQNLIVYGRGGGTEMVGAPLSLVHPGVWTVYRG